MKTAIIATLAGFSATALAKETFYEEEGNVKGDFGPGWINYGTQPPYDLFDRINDECLTTGCSNVVIEQDTLVIEGTDLMGGKVTIEVDASFNDEGERGDKAQMVEMVKDLVSNSGMEVNRDVKYFYGSNGGAGGIPADPVEPSYADQYKATDKLQFRVEADDGGLLAELGFTVKVDVIDPSMDACEIITTTGASLAYVVSGIAGGIFTLASMACG